MLPVEMVKNAPVSSCWIDNILYQRLWSCNGLFTELAYHQEGGPLYASVQKFWLLNLCQEPTVTDVYQSLWAQRGWTRLVCKALSGRREWYEERAKNKASPDNHAVGMATFECVFSGLDVLNEHTDSANVFGNINKICTDLSTFQWKQFTGHFLPI